ncbi:MAG: helix-turn-helix transcriptional regulator [Longimicrobiales bacterium]
MADRVTAEDRLHRLLWLLPVAAQDGGASLSSLARELEVEPRELLRDIDEATTRAFHHPPGTVDAFSILIEAGEASDTTIEVHTTGEFLRPARLTPREALAVALGLRAMAAEVIADRRAAVLGVARRLERELSAPDVRSADADEPANPRRSRRATAAGNEDASAREAGENPEADAAESCAAIETVLAEATTRHRRCRILYVKPGEAPAERAIEPYRLIHAAGAWYVLGRDDARDEMRLFRLDRIASVQLVEDATFDVPADFDPADYLTEEGLPFFTAREEEVVVRYNEPAARWIAESTGVAPDADGCVRVHHRVADRSWLVRHVLGFGGAAVVIEPAEVRQEVADAAARFL